MRHPWRDGAPSSSAGGRPESPSVCHYLTEQGAPIRPALENECLVALPALPLFTDPDETTCGLFTEDFVFIKQVDLGLCVTKGLCIDLETGTLVRSVWDMLGNLLTQVIPYVPETKAELQEKIRATKPRKSSYRTLFMSGEYDAVMARYRRPSEILGPAQSSKPPRISGSAVKRLAINQFLAGGSRIPRTNTLTEYPERSPDLDSSFLRNKPKRLTEDLCADFYWPS